MKINRDNYEAFFLDYHEGQLSPGMAEEVLLFVEQNPDLQRVFHDFESVSLVTEQDVVFEHKASLKKNQVRATALISDQNYEVYLLNETEGLLNAEERLALSEFIRLNPQLERERKLFALAHLPVESEIQFESKATLKHKAIPVGEITAENYEDFILRALEGDLSPAGQLQLDTFMQFNPQFEKDRKLFAHTILSPDTSIVFEHKENLKQKIVPIRRMVYYVLSTAASLALLFSVYFLLDRNQVPASLADRNAVKNKVNSQVTTPVPVIPQQMANAATQPAGTSKAVKNNVHNYAQIAGSQATTAAHHEVIQRERRDIVPLEPMSAAKITTPSYVQPEYMFIRMSQMYQNENYAFYYNLKLAESIAYAEMNARDKNPLKTIFKSLAGKTEDLFASKLDKRPVEEKKNISFWTVAEAGVQTFNKLTSSELELNVQKNEEGKVIGYDLESRYFDIEKALAK